MRRFLLMLVLFLGILGATAFGSEFIASGDRWLAYGSFWLAAGFLLILCITWLRRTK